MYIPNDVRQRITREILGSAASGRDITRTNYFRSLSQNNQQRIVSVMQALMNQTTPPPSPQRNQVPPGAPQRPSRRRTRSPSQQARATRPRTGGVANSSNNPNNANNARPRRGLLSGRLNPPLRSLPDIRRQINSSSNSNNNIYLGPSSPRSPLNLPRAPQRRRRLFRGEGSRS